MRQAISRLFGGKRAAGKKTPQAAMVPSRADRAETRDNPHTIEDNSDNAVRRQLVQMMLRDGLRKHGIPAGWIECRVLVVHSRSRGPGLHVKLVMRHWDMLLLTYARAFEQQLIAAIQEFEPAAPSWLHGISWELDVGDSCPYLDMPDPAIWREIPATPDIAMPKPVLKTRTAQASPAPAAPENDEESDLRRDLERMFAIRDANIESAFADAAPLDFQNTEPAQR